MHVALYQVSNGKAAQILDLNQVINALQQPSGGQEKGSYILAMPGYADNALCSSYWFSRSTGSTPVSVSVDASYQTNNGYKSNTPSTNFLTSGGFQIYNNSNGSQGNPLIGGKWTLQF